MSVTNIDEINLVQFLLKVPTDNTAEHIFNMWNDIYNTSLFDIEDIEHLISMINIYKNINLPKDLMIDFLKG